MKKRWREGQKKQNKGFTLVELIVVIMLLLILVSALGTGLSFWSQWVGFTRQNDAARTLFVAAQNQLTDYSEHGQLEPLEEALEESDSANWLDLTQIRDENGIAYDPEKIWPASAGKGSQAGKYRSTVCSLIGTPTDYQNYQEGTLNDPAKKALYDFFASYLYDTSLLNAVVCVEFSPEEGQVFAVLYRDNLGKDGTFTYIESEENEQKVSIASRETSYRRERMVGYYGVNTLAKSTSAGSERPSINEVRLHNEETLNLTFQLGKVKEATGELTYGITICDNTDGKELLMLKLDGTQIGNENSRRSVACETTRYLYGEDGELQVQDMGEYQVPAWADPEGTIHVILDAADLEADTSLYAAAYSSLMSGEELNDLDIYVSDLKKTTSFHRFGVLAEEIYCIVEASGEGYKTTPKKQSNHAQVYFADVSETEEGNNRTYTVENARHLYNIRYLEDFTDEERLEMGESAEERQDIYYQIAGIIDWRAFAAEGNLYKNGGDAATPPLYVEAVADGENQAFPSIRKLRDCATLEAAAGEETAGIFGLCLTQEENEERQVYGSEKTRQVGLVLVNEGTIRNLLLDQTSVSGSGRVGTFCGVNQGTLEGLTLTDSGQTSFVTGGRYVGGVTAENQGTIMDCRVGAEDEPVQIQSKTPGTNAGGIAGLNSGIIQGSEERTAVYAQLSFADHSVSYYGNMGGIAGKNEHTILRYQFSGRVEGTSNNPENPPQYDPNAEQEADEILLYGYGGIAGINGDKSEGAEALIEECSIANVSVTGIGDLGNIANLGGVAGVNEMGAMIRKIYFGSGDSEPWQVHLGGELITAGTSANIYVGTGESTEAAAHSGGVSGCNSGTIQQIGYDEEAEDSSGELRASSLIVEVSRGNAGGIAGFNRRTGVIQKVSTGDFWYVVAAAHTQENGCGGIIGYQAGESGLDRCVNRASVEKSAAGSSGVGGIAGRMDSAVSQSYTVSNCVNYGRILGRQSAGGITGILRYYGGTFLDCINYGAVTAQENQGTGGIIGYFSNMSSAVSLYGCENHGSINLGIETAAGCGGLAGDARGNVTVDVQDCVNTGLIQGSDTSAGMLGLGDQLTMSSNILNCRNYGYAWQGTNMGGILANAVTKNIRVQHCFGLAMVEAPVAKRAETAENNYYLRKNEEDSQDYGIGQAVISEEAVGGYRLILLEQNGSRITQVGISGFSIDPVSSLDREEAKTDTSLQVLGDETDNIRYQVYEADDTYLTDALSYEELPELPVPTNFSWSEGEGASYQVSWDSEEEVSFYQCEVRYYADTEGISQLGETVENRIYTNRISIPLTDIQGTQVKYVEIRVRAGADIVAENNKVRRIWSEYSEWNGRNVNALLPSPQYHLNLVLKKDQTLAYQAELDNREDYITFLQALGENRTREEAIELLRQISIHIQADETEIFSFNAYDGKSGEQSYYNGNVSGAEISFGAYAQAEPALKCINSAMILRISKAPSHTVWKSDTKLASVLLSPLDEEKGADAGFRGDRADSLEYQIRMQQITDSVSMQTELVAKDQTLGIPLCVSDAVIKLTDAEEGVSVNLKNFPVDLMNPLAYGALTVRAYPLELSGSVIHTGYEADLSEYQSEQGEGVTWEVLENLYVTEAGQITGEQTETPLLSAGQIASGFVISLESDDTYRLSYNALLDYNNRQQDAYEAETQQTEMQTQVFYYRLNEIQKTAKTPVLLINAQEDSEGVYRDGDPNLGTLVLTWDLNEKGYEGQDGNFQYERDTIYEYEIIGYRADDEKVTILSGDYTTGIDGENTLTLNASDWDYERVLLCVSRRGEMDKDGFTTQIPSGVKRERSESNFQGQSTEQLEDSQAILNAANKELVIYDQLSVPDVRVLCTEDRYGAVSSMTEEEFQQGLRLIYQPSGIQKTEKGGCQIAVAIYAQPSGVSETQIIHSGDGEGGKGYWNSGALLTLIGKEKSQRMEGTRDFASLTLQGISAEYAGKWMKVVMRGCTDTGEVSQWSDEDAQTEHTQNEIWIQIPRIQTAAPDLEEDLARARLSFRLNDLADGYHIQLVQVDTNQASEVFYTSHLYLEKTEKGKYQVYMISDYPNVQFEKQTGKVPVSSQSALAVYIGNIAAGEILPLPWGSEEEKGRIRLQITESGDAMILQMPAAETDSGLHTREISIQTWILPVHQDAYQASDSFIWYHILEQEQEQETEERNNATENRQDVWKNEEKTEEETVTLEQ